MSIGAYPRACGGPPGANNRAGEVRGLSPRLRGTRQSAAGGDHRPWPIPAPAGDPEALEGAKGVGKAYPRACGGPVDAALTGGPVRGLSPRLRGTRWEPRIRLTRVWPIPAPAGDPQGIGPKSTPCPAYPRACGGPLQQFGQALSGNGLSPRLRGTPFAAAGSGGGGGPIPAPAGDPRPSSREARAAWAYPRACGGPVQQSEVRDKFGGLSPRLRGTPKSRTRSCVGVRPIPAPAGDPRRFPGRRRWSRAYPRACGGPTVRDLPPCLRQGLSPRLRGTLWFRQGLHGRCGPIPAPAGDPCDASCAPTRQRAYPRACGGPIAAFAGAWGFYGLSPRLRGTRVHRR